MGSNSASVVSGDVAPKSHSASGVETNTDELNRHGVNMSCRGARRVEDPGWSRDVRPGAAHALPAWGRLGRRWFTLAALGLSGVTPGAHTGGRGWARIRERRGTPARWPSHVFSKPRSPLGVSRLHCLEVFVETADALNSSHCPGRWSSRKPFTRLKDRPI